MKFLRLTTFQIERLYAFSKTGYTYVRLDTQTLENGDVLVLIAERKSNTSIFVNWVTEKRFLELDPEKVYLAV